MILQFKSHLPTIPIIDPKVSVGDGGGGGIAVVIVVVGGGGCVIVVVVGGGVGGVDGADSALYTTIIAFHLEIF